MFIDQRQSTTNIVRMWFSKPSTSVELVCSRLMIIFWEGMFTFKINRSNFSDICKPVQSYSNWSRLSVKSLQFLFIFNSLLKHSFNAKTTVGGYVTGSFFYSHRIWFDHWSKMDWSNYNLLPNSLSCSKVIPAMISSVRSVDTNTIIGIRWIWKFFYCFLSNNNW